MAGNLGRAFVQVYADLSKFTPGLKQKIKAALDEQTRGIPLNELDRSAEQAGESATEHLAEGVNRRLGPEMEKSGKKGGNSLAKGMSSVVGAMGALLMPALITFGIAAAGALAPAAVALSATIPAAIFTLIGTMAVLKMATSGVGEALKTAFDPSKAKEFDAAMQKLTPAARAFVMEVKGLRPAFKGLQQDIQQTFFTQFQGSLTRMSNKLLPTLRSGLHMLSKDIGQMGNGLMKALGGGKEDLASIFISAHRAIKPFIPLLGQFATAMLTIGAVAGPMLAELSKGFAGLLLQFFGFIQEASDSGALATFFDDMLIVLQQVGAVLGDVVRLFMDLVTAAGAVGGDTLGVIGRLVEMLADFFGSAQGQATLIAAFTLINAALDTMMAVIGPLLPVVGQLVTEFAGGLTDALKTVTPYLQSAAEWLAKHPDLIKAAIGAWMAYKGALVIVAAYQAVVAAMNPVTWIVLAVAAIVAGATLIYQNWSVVTDALSSAGDAIMGFFIDITLWIASIGIEIGNWFTITLPGFFATLVGKIATFVGRIPGIIGGAFRSAWSWAKREVREGADAVVSFVSKLPGRISGFMRNVGRDILSGLKGGINNVIAGFNSGIDNIAGFIHIGLPHIPLLANGGLITSPTLAVVGEAGKEAVIPMSNPAKAQKVAQQTGLLDMLGSRANHSEATSIKVYLGTREITDILDVRIDKKMDDQAAELAYGTR